MTGIAPLDPHTTIGLLLSGGLDSAVLLGHLLAQRHQVQPLYVRTGAAWQAEELQAIERYLDAMRCPLLKSLVELDMPLGDLYTDHWSMTGRRVPDSESSDAAVYLPGRNPLLMVKAVVWCHLNGIEVLAVGLLSSNPFADGTPRFLQSFESLMNEALTGHVQIVCPFRSLAKAEVLELGRRLPLEWTFSCLSPQAGHHCGRCNKCAERKAAFRAASRADKTVYA